MSDDPINHPKHYTSHPSGVEAITVTEHMSFCIGNVIKYCWRAGQKSPDTIEDLKKARWYLDREIARLEKGCRSFRVGDPVRAGGRMGTVYKVWDNKDYMFPYMVRFDDGEFCNYRAEELEAV